MVIAHLSPNIADAFAHLVDGVWDGRVDRPLLEACRLRVCELIGAPADAGRHPDAPPPDLASNPRAAACLAFAEVWVIDPHAMTDELAAEVRSHLNDQEVAAFTIGLATIEAQARIAVATP